VFVGVGVGERSIVFDGVFVWVGVGVSEHAKTLSVKQLLQSR
jgi:predicted Co/Zn/Cd cation transporter (cation efflux family)